MRNFPLVVFGLVLLAASTLAGAVAAADYTITLQQMKFGPVPAELHVGDVIVWQNKDILRHTATARDRSFDVDLPPGTENRMPLTQAGSFAFFCKFHPGMTGTLIVSP
jgi:plastocyanin